MFLFALSLDKLFWSWDGSLLRIPWVNSLVDMIPSLSASRSLNTWTISLLVYLGAIEAMKRENSSKSIMLLWLWSILPKRVFGFNFSYLIIAITSSSFLDKTSFSDLKSTNRTFYSIIFQGMEPFFCASKKVKSV